MIRLFVSLAVVGLVMMTFDWSGGGSQAFGGGYDRPATRSESEPLGGGGQARHRGDQPAAGGAGRARHSQARRQRGRRGHRHQRHARAGRADELRHRRRSVRASIGTPRRRSCTASTPAAAAPTSSIATSSSRKGLTAIPGEGAAVPGRCRAASPAGKTCDRDSAPSRWPRFWRRRSATPKAAFPVSEIIAGYWRAGAGGLQNWPDSAKTYLPDGHAPVEGEVFRNPKLAASYRRDRQATAATRSTRATSRRRSSRSARRTAAIFRCRDFADHTADWVEPVSTNYRGYDVWELPPNGQGIAALQMLNLLEPLRRAQDGARQRRVPAPVHRGQEAGLRRSGHVLRRPGVRQAADRGADLEGVRGQAAAS